MSTLCLYMLTLFFIETLLHGFENILLVEYSIFLMHNAEYSIFCFPYFFLLYAKHYDAVPHVTHFSFSEAYLNTALKKKEMRNRLWTWTSLADLILPFFDFCLIFFIISFPTSVTTPKIMK